MALLVFITPMTHLKSSQLILTSAIKLAQKSYGYKQNGIISAGLIKDLNVPVRNRIEQMLINMERMRWMPKESPGRRILANIPEFKIHVLDGMEKDI